MKIEQQKELVLNGEWDVLVVLDACRFNVFDALYREFLGDCGSVRRVWSSGRHTTEWLYKTFGDIVMDDVVYVSGNPYVNSAGIAIENTHAFPFVAPNHFKRIIDAWEIWENGTVHPRDLVKYATIAFDVHKDSRFILHFMQPHFPYLLYGGRNHKPLMLQKCHGIQPSIHWIDLVRRGGNRVVSNVFMWRVENLLGLLPEGSMGDTWVKWGHEGIMRGYRHNLAVALSALRGLLKRYKDKRWTVTADHGERLGEHGNYGHNLKFGRDDDALRYVPWLEITW